MVLRLKSEKLAMRKTWETTTYYLVKRVSIECHFIDWLLFESLTILNCYYSKEEGRKEDEAIYHYKCWTTAVLHLPCSGCLFPLLRGSWFPKLSFTFLRYNITLLIQMFYVLLSKFNLKASSHIPYLILYYRAIHCSKIS